tara:strand:+ start:229919 stop:230047 length:129 start_codon:yes stop_codon:yes gene_type:complete
MLNSGAAEAMPLSNNRELKKAATGRAVIVLFIVFSFAYVVLE